MLIEAAKGGHTNVVQILIDYPNNFRAAENDQAAATSPGTPETADQGPTAATVSNARVSATVGKSVLRKANRIGGNGVQPVQPPVAQPVRLKALVVNGL